MFKLYFFYTIVTYLEDFLNDDNKLKRKIYELDRKLIITINSQVMNKKYTFLYISLLKFFLLIIIKISIYNYIYLLSIEG